MPPENRDTLGQAGGAGLDAGTGMIYLGMSPWAGMWRNRHQLMTRFARMMPVLYVEPWVRTRELRRRLASPAKILSGLVAPASHDSAGGVTVLRSPPHRPVAHGGRLHEATVARWVEYVLRNARGAGITRPILWVTQPGMGSVVGKFGEILSIYHIVDEYSGYTGQDLLRRTNIQQTEQALLDKVDLSIVVSRELYEAKHGESRKVFVVPNAVDFDVFAEASAQAAVPADLAAIPRPRIGYSGLIGARLNLDLVAAAAEARPDFHYVFVGSVDSRECSHQLMRLQNRSNVHFLGEKPAARVPEYVCGFDVGMLPYNINLETCHISPLKLYEYLAAGLPVVSTNIPAAQPFSDLINFAAGSDEFTRAVDLALDRDSEENRQKRRMTAQANTWNDRVLQIRSIIGEALRAKGFPPGEKLVKTAS